MQVCRCFSPRNRLFQPSSCLHPLPSGALDVWSKSWFKLWPGDSSVQSSAQTSGCISFVLHGKATATQGVFLVSWSVWAALTVFCTQYRVPGLWTIGIYCPQLWMLEASNWGASVVG